MPSVFLAEHYVSRTLSSSRPALPPSGSSIYSIYVCIYIYKERSPCFTEHPGTTDSPHLAPPLRGWPFDVLTAGSYCSFTFRDQVKMTTIVIPFLLLILALTAVPPVSLTVSLVIRGILPATPSNSRTKITFKHLWDLLFQSAAQDEIEGKLKKSWEELKLSLRLLGFFL